MEIIKETKSETTYLMSKLTTKLQSSRQYKSEREKQIPYANTYIWNLKEKKKWS